MSLPATIDKGKSRRPIQLNADHVIVVIPTSDVCHHDIEASEKWAKCCLRATREFKFHGLTSPCFLLAYTRMTSRKFRRVQRIEYVNKVKLAVLSIVFKSRAIVILQDTLNRVGVLRCSLPHNAYVRCRVLHVDTS